MPPRPARIPSLKWKRNGKRIGKNTILLLRLKETQASQKNTCWICSRTHQGQGYMLGTPKDIPVSRRRPPKKVWLQLFFSIIEDLGAFVLLASYNDLSFQHLISWLGIGA